MSPFATSWLLFQKLLGCHKERENHFQNSWDRLSIVSHLQSPNTHNSINKKAVVIDIWPIQDDTDPVLIATIDADLGYERSRQAFPFIVQNLKAPNW
jgi:hypothetical protein